jgi:hypothetical protein
MYWSTTLVTLPTQETKDRIAAIFGQSPFSVNVDHLSVRLAQSVRTTTKWEANPEAFYEARFTEFAIRYDSLRGRSILSGLLDCYEMSARANELVPSVDQLIPELVFCDPAPPLSQANRSFLNSVSHTLVAREERPFTFANELKIVR